MRINMGKATYSHFSIVAHTDEAMLLPAGSVLKSTMPAKPTMNRAKPTHTPAASRRKSRPKTTMVINAILGSIR